MYIPSAFTVDDLQTLHAFMQRYSFATVVSTTDNDAQASHLPLLLEPHEGRFGRLIGHMAKANPQWKTAADKPVLVIFQGPHAYISPSWYAEDNVVPTWNYAAVHTCGVMKLETDNAKVRRIVEQYVDFYEAAMVRPWSLETPEPAFVDQLVDGIVGFTIDIDRIEGKWKLSQNHSEERRQRVIAGLQKRQHAGDTEVAEMMQTSGDF